MGVRDYKGTELIPLLDSGDISILEMLGAQDLKDEMRSVGRHCIRLTRLVFSHGDTRDLRKKAVRLLRIAAPCSTEARLPSFSGTAVVGFNHPSLGEICRLVHLGMYYYPDKEFLFPVNLPWYESIVGIIPELNKLGIHITPMITPATEKKLNARFESDSEKLKDVQTLKMMFDRKYIREIKEIAKKHGCIFVAPSATRQKEIIGDYVHPSMSVIANIIKRSNGDQALFIPLAVFAPKRGDRGLNLLKDYRIIPCREFTPDEVNALTAGRDREFDFTFLRSIERTYLEHEMN